MQRSFPSTLTLVRVAITGLFVNPFASPVVKGGATQATSAQKPGVRQIALQQANAQQTGCGTMDAPFGEALCLRVSFAGEVTEGQTFQRKFGDNLLFRLNPKPAHFGWTIEIRPQPQNAATDSEYVWVVTPPYRSYNPRDIDTSYGTSAQEAVGYSPRDFNFVLNEEQFNRAGDLVGLAVMSRPQSDQRTQEEFEKASENAIRDLRAFSVSKGRLTILDSHLTAPVGEKDPGSIKWLKFNVEVQVPCGFATAWGSDMHIDASRCAHDESKKKN